MSRFIELVDDESGDHYMIDVEKIAYVQTKKQGASTIGFLGGGTLTLRIIGPSGDAFRKALGLKPRTMGPSSRLKYP